MSENEDENRDADNFRGCCWLCCYNIELQCLSLERDL
jgi:hypothetical protein